MKWSFYSNVPATYMEDIINEVMPKIGVYFEEYKDIYTMSSVVAWQQATKLNYFMQIYC